MTGLKMLIKMWRELPMWSKIGLVFSFALFATAVAGCNFKFWKNYNEDNIVEEMVEDFIEHKTGIDIDLSPGSEEKKENDVKRVKWYQPNIDYLGYKMNTKPPIEEFKDLIDKGLTQHNLYYPTDISSTLNFIL